MDEDRLRGTAKQVSGSIKEAIGKVTGDTKTEAEGAAEKARGGAQMPQASQKTRPAVH